MTIDIRKQIIIALLYFFFTACLGLFLRLFPIVNFSSTYKFIVHTHSHIALLGWVYTALISCINYLFIDKKNNDLFYKIFWVTQFTILGMMATFPFQGYALFSIIFTTLFLIASYWFIYYFFKNVKYNLKETISYKFIRFSLLLMLLSSIGPWVLGVVMATSGKTTMGYKIAIYFYLHFQYNGWFIFALLGFFFYVLEKKKINFSIKKSNQFLKWMQYSVFLTFFLSVLFTKPHFSFYLFGGIGSLLQIMAVFFFIKLLLPLKKIIIDKIRNRFTLVLLKISAFLFILKIVLQVISAFPYFVNLATQQLDFVIGYIHLTFLGVVSISLFSFLNEFNFIKLPKIGVNLFLLGFAISEILIFYKGFSTWLRWFFPNNYFIYLIIASACMPLGILYILIKNIHIKN